MLQNPWPFLFVYINHPSKVEKVFLKYRPSVFTKARKFAAEGHENFQFLVWGPRLYKCIWGPVEGVGPICSLGEPDVLVKGRVLGDGLKWPHQNSLKEGQKNFRFRNSKFRYGHFSPFLTVFGHFQNFQFRKRKFFLALVKEILIRSKLRRLLFKAIVSKYFTSLSI